MPILRISHLSIAYGIHRLLDDARLVINRGDRIGLLGRNGEGKSTLLNIINGDTPFDDGEIQGMDKIKVAKLDQAPNLKGNQTVYQNVASGLGDIGKTISEYHHISQNISDDADLEKLSALQARIEAQHAWSLINNIEKTMSRLALKADASLGSLSGGWQRRVSLARALVIEPDLLLLDEPTNHLDLDAIAWLENQLVQFNGALLFVTHDRSFLNTVATKIVDLDRGKLISWPGNYTDYLRRKATSLKEEARQNALEDKNLAQEEQWIRQGIKARRTRNEGRVRALLKLRTERAARRTQQGKVNFKLTDESRSGKRLIEVNKLSFAYPDKSIVADFSTTIMRFDRVGIVGPNGAGKSTLINLLLGKIKPDSGNVKLGTNLNIAYFDQLRSQIDSHKTIAEFIGEGRDHIDIGGRSRHIMSYLSDFLFAPTRARSPINALSGGERARVLLAYLFSMPVNFLVLDEPTNDLDIETLELLEELLLDFKGTLLLVSHDRTFMDNVITSSLVLDNQGNVNEYVGGYTDAMRQFNDQIQSQNPVKKKTNVSPSPTLVSTNKEKLSHKVQREIETLPNKIDALEQKQTRLTEALMTPDIYQTDPTEARKLNKSLTAINQQIDQLMDRWAKLENSG